jgi:hypothetical protein
MNGITFQSSFLVTLLLTYKLLFLYVDYFISEFAKSSFRYKGHPMEF